MNKITNNNDNQKTTPKLNIIPKEHFWVSGIRQGFNLNIIIPIYAYISNNIDTIETSIEKEVTIGDTTIVYSVNEIRDTIYLHTGWEGTKNKKMKYQHNK
ncbi:MAG: hypothetical protein U9Q30_06520 [Campylobacterota bacterium]|nr:hypothetical protein [Campylobacterota bacterium]